MMKRITAIIFLILALCSCSRRLGLTSVELADPVRHYYPILRGQELIVIAKLTNTGDTPLVVTDVQPSCGCITTDFKGDTMIPPGQSMYVTMKYDSKKNVGLVEHSVRFWGNIEPDGMAQMRFDVNVVPDANYHHDYEELYDKEQFGGTLKDLVNGTGRDTGLGYYTDL